jgi:hypothetical protein
VGGAGGGENALPRDVVLLVQTSRRGIIPYVSQEDPLVYCNNIPELVNRRRLSDTTLVHGGCSSIPVTEV